MFSNSFFLDLLSFYSNYATPTMCSYSQSPGSWSTCPPLPNSPKFLPDITHSIKIHVHQRAKELTHETTIHPYTITHVRESTPVPYIPTFRPFTTFLIPPIIPKIPAKFPAPPFFPTALRHSPYPHGNFPMTFINVPKHEIYYTASGFQ